MLVFVWMFAYVSLCQSLYNISGIHQSFDKKTNTTCIQNAYHCLTFQSKTKRISTIKASDSYIVWLYVQCNLTFVIFFVE